METTHRILVLFAHPRVRTSRVNRAMVEAVRDLNDVTVNDLYEAYPEHNIDVAKEQELLLAHDCIVFQHPFYWYSTPSILKEWQDLVLEHGWAYGRDGRALHGKTMFSAISAGGSDEAYQHDGLNSYTVRELLAPIELTARLCGIDYLPPFVVHETHRLTGKDIEHHAAGYRIFLERLRDGRIDLEAARILPRLNNDLDRLIGG